MNKPNSRRNFLVAAGGLATGIALPATVAAQMPGAPAATLEAIRRVVGTASVNRGKVTLDLPALVDNGNAVSLAVRVDSPMSESEYVKAIHLFTEKNPQPDVASFHLGPRAGRASVATRIRLADSQAVIAICEMSDGSFWSGSANTVVTLAACLEEI